MNKNWKIIEKIIGGLLIAICSVILIIIFWGINTTLQSNLEQSDLTLLNTSIYKLMITYHHQILKGLLGILSGFLLLRNKRIGWIMSIATCLIYGIETIMIIFIKKSEEIKIFESESYLIFAGLIAILFLSLTITLTNKQFRIKYSPNRKSWIAVGIITLIFMTDLLITNG